MNAFIREGITELHCHLVCDRFSKTKWLIVGELGASGLKRGISDTGERKVGTGRNS